MSLTFITSPAKTLNVDSWKAKNFAQPEFLEEAKEIVSGLREYNTTNLAKVLNVSLSLAELNHQRYQEWSYEHNQKNSKPAILCYAGDIFRQFDATLFKDIEQEYAHKSVRILSGLYGVLRAYDLIQPYRLEMKTKLPFLQPPHLWKYWREKMTTYINQSLQDNQSTHLIDLASKEYSKPIDYSMVHKPIMEIDFKQKVKNELKTVAIYSKQARGVMLGWAIQNQIGTVKQLKQFNLDGYKLDESTDTKIVFSRPKP